MRGIRRAVGGAAGVLLLAGAAAAQFSADFETPPYNLGPLEGQLIWTNWMGINGTTTNVVATQNHTAGGSQSIEVANGSDTVANFDALGGGSFDSGTWTVSAWVLVPTGSTGSVFFLVMNQWDVSGAPVPEWNVQLEFNSNGGRAVLSTPNGIFQRPLVTGQWVEVRAVYNLNANNVDVYYDNFLMQSYDPRCGVTNGCTTPYSGSFIDAIDLYPDPATNPSPVFFDDIKVEQGGGTSGTAVCFGDGSGTACPCFNTGGSGQGCANGTGSGGVLSGSGTASVSNDTFSLTADGVINNNGLFFQGNNTIAGGAGSVFGDGIRCCGGGVVRIQVVNPPGSTSPATAQMTETATTNGPGGTITAGTKKCYQFWYRDPASSPCGAQFNLTNAVTVTWQP